MSIVKINLVLTSVALLNLCNLATTAPHPAHLQLAPASVANGLNLVSPSNMTAPTASRYFEISSSDSYGQVWTEID